VGAYSAPTDHLAGLRACGLQKKRGRMERRENERMVERGNSGIDNEGDGDKGWGKGVGNKRRKEKEYKSINLYLYQVKKPISSKPKRIVISKKIYMHADAKSNHKHSQRNTSATHRNNSNVSEVNYQHIARRPTVCTVYMTEIVHNNVKTGELQIDQNSSDTVIFAVPKKHFNTFMITASKFLLAFSSKTRP